MKKFLILFLSFFLLFNLNSFSQSEFDPYFGIYGVLSLPTGDYGDDKGDDASFAKLGYGGGIEFTMPLGAPGLGWVTSASFILNPLDEKAIAEEVFGDSDMEDYLSTKPIRNIPILTGLKYQSEVGSMEIYGMAQIGINLFKIGDWEMEDVYYEGYPIDLMKFEFDGGSTFGFAVGAGLIFNQSFTLSARYFSLGEAKLDATVDVDGDSMPWEDLPDKKISMFVITAGINF